MLLRYPIKKAFIVTLRKASTFPIDPNCANVVHKDLIYVRNTQSKLDKINIEKLIDTSIIIRNKLGVCMFDNANCILLYCLHV